VPTSVRDVYPCSQAQRGFWFEEQLHPHNRGLNVAARWRLEGELATATIAEAWRVLIIRHEALRTRFAILDGEPVQVVEPEVPFSVTDYDLSGLDDNAAAIEAERVAIAEAQTAFDLTVAPLLRVSRIIRSATQSTLLVTAHHSVCDGWSVGILAREMGQTCAALQRSEANLLSPLPMRFGDFAKIEYEWLQNETFDSEIASLRESLHGLKQFELIPDHPRPPIQTYNSKIASLVLDRSITTALNQIARSNGCTLFMASFAVLLTLLHRYTGETDIAIGTQVAGRDEEELEGIVGCFINTVPLRVDLSGDPTFVELLDRVGEIATDSFDLRHVPLERLVHMLRPKRDLSRTTLFSVNFGLHTFVQDTQYERFKLTDLPSYTTGALYDLNFFMTERSDGWRVSCEYNTDLFDDDNIGGLVERLELLFRSIIADPEKRISQFSLLSDADRYELVVSANQTQMHYPADRIVTDLFTDRVMQTPTAIALVCGDVTLTYAELDAASNRLARELIKRGLGHGNLVGVLLERSPELIIALLAVLKAGSAYIPLDPKYPQDRLAYIITNSRLPAVISRSALAARIDVRATSYICLDTEAPAIAENSTASLETSALPSDLAYVIYTSGSTGWPKGVQIEHRALQNLLCAMAVSPGIASTDVLVSVTTISFDIAALEVFLPLITGARLVIADETEVIDADALLRLMRRSATTIMQATPITWQLLIEGGWTGDPPIKMLCGGEALSRKLADQLLERGGDLWNMYGPTETTIWSSAALVKPDAGPVLVGGPIANTQFYVLDANHELVPPGVPGELFIGGDGVARGYFDRPDLTQERFVPDPFRDVSGAKLYRTGDVVRRRGPSSLEFLGRSDQQIKLRGFRIELGEIEATLLRQSEVVEAVAVIRGDDAAEKALWAFVVPSPDARQSGPAWIARLRSQLSESLPYYMVPAPIMLLDALPRTPNGKVDRRALPQTASADVSELGESPSTPTEITLAARIAKMLGRETIGRRENIFALGFNSLLAVRLVAQMEKDLGLRVPLRAFFDAQTVEQLALRAVRSQDVHTAIPDVEKPVVTHNAHGGRPPFVYIHSDRFVDGNCCSTLAEAIGADQPMHAISINEALGPTIEWMARHVVQLIRDVQPNGPYRLGGFCAAGFLAYEVARVLRAEGDDVERLLIVNASAPAKRPILFADPLIRVIGLNPRLDPNLRGSICSNLARLFEAVGEGPRSVLRFFVDRARALSARSGGSGDFEPIKMRRGTREAENYLAYYVATLTFHPLPYDGELTLVWGAEQRFMPGDTAAGWRAFARSVCLALMSGGHYYRVGVLGSKLAELLR
jgi:amino acid adenylation domain-containing protein